MSVRDLDAGTVIDGRYRVKHRIGSGGMADVYCAVDEQLGRDVALKLLHRRFAEDREFVERFRREASSAAALQHPHVVGVYDRGEWDGTSYIAMEHLEGRTLKQVIVDEAPLEPIRSIDLVVQVLRAARFAHKRGVIHRDLKPQNVIVDPEGRAKVTDFGIARAGASDMTQTGSIMGTAQYLSPEQAQGLPVDDRSDLYSVGVVLYEMLTGRVPFEGDSAVSIALKQVAEQPTPPRVLNPSIPPELEAVVLRAIAKDPAQRFQDADEMITVLDRVRGHIAAGAVGADRRGEATTAFQPMPPPIGRITDAYGAVPPPVYPPEPLPPDEPRRRRAWPWIVLAVVVLLAGGALAYALTRPAQVAVPNVVGKPYQGASAVLRNAGFDVNIDRVRSPQPVDQVLREDPQPSKKVDEGSTVTLTVSDGPGTAGVPNVIGDGRRAAAKKLTAKGFKVSEREAPSADVAHDHVIDTAPSPGSQAEVGSEVVVTVSSGRQKVAVPDVVKLDVAEATAQIEDAGLRVQVSEKDSTEPAGTVLAESPLSGTSVTEGSTVTLTVAREPQDVAVPDVTGEPEGQAVNDISAAKLSPTTVDKTVTDPTQDGVVLRQNPRGGRKVKKGDRVTLTIGRFNPTSTTPPGGGDETQTAPPTTTTQ